MRAALPAVVCALAGLTSAQDPQRDLIAAALSGAPFSEIDSACARFVLAQARSRCGARVGTALWPWLERSARDGWVAAGLRVSSGNVWDGFSVLFAKARCKKTDPKSCYFSDWIGGRGGSPDVLLGVPDRPVAGIHGRRADVIDAIGLSGPRPLQIAPADGDRLRVAA